ncbi:MAG: toll/interleukin-1 receptor domain-containing protein [Hyphomicrobiaceae bacterium]
MAGRRSGEQHGGEMARVFISHAVSDGAAKAGELVSRLEARGQACWIAPRDVAPGRTYPAQILAAIRDGRGLVLLLTEAANASPDVLQEVQLAHSAKKLIVPVAVGEVRLSDDLGYFLSVRQHLRWSSAEAVAAALDAVLPPLAVEDATLSARDAGLEAVAAVAAAAASETGVSGPFRMVVRSTGEEPDTLWLCSEADYRDPRCLSVAIRGAARQALVAKHGRGFGDAYQGRTIVVDGVARKQRIDFISGGKPTGHYYFQTHVDVDDPGLIRLMD